MTSIDVNDVLKRTQSTANGSTTDFSFSFQVNNTNEIKVYEDSTLKTEGTHYDIVDSSSSAGLNSNGTGVVKFKTSPTDYTPANNKVITILSVMSIARASVYTSGGNLTASALEADYDRIHRILGDFREVKSRTLIAPEYSPTDIDMTIPSKASRLGKILGFNSSTGNPEMFTYLTNENITALDGLTAGTVLASKYVLVDANKDITGFRNITLSGELDAGSLDISGDADIDGTLEADAITIGGVTLAETISDTVGAMVGSNTETGITVTYEDSDNTLDFVIGSTSITNAMLAGSIADSKLSTITTAGKVAIGALEIDGASDIGADLADADLIIVDDGAGGTEVKSELTRVKKYIYSSLSGDATASDSGALTIANDAVESGMLNDNIISGQTAITSGLSSTDELLFSDAGSIKRMDISVLTDYYKDLNVTETNKTLTSPVLNTGVSGTAILDEDDLSTNSATQLATQQSIKAYVDAQTLSLIDEDNMSTNSASRPPSQQSVKAYIATQIATKDNSDEITEGSSNLYFTNARADARITNALIDEDDMSTNSATKIPSQQSVKAYVDAQKADMQFVLEDGDGTEVQITKDKEVKFVEGGGLDINWTDTSTGSDGDPYDLTFTINADQTDITSILATDVKIGEDDQTKIDFETANQINFYADNTKRVTIDTTGLTVNSGSLETATIDFTDGDNAMTIADGGAVTFAQVPVFPDDTIETNDIQDNAVTLAKMAGLARGSLITGDSNGDPSALAIGTNGQFLKSDGNDLVFGSATISGLACDDLTVGDDAVSIATSSGNITIDAQGNNTDIIFKGTDGNSDITALTLDMSNAGTAIFNKNINLESDSSKIKFGVDKEIELAHVHDVGLKLNSTSQLQFGDSGTYIHQSADGVLDLVSDTEIEINATSIDMNGALTQDGGAVFNEDSADVDFRVESNGNANMLFVDGGNDAVCIGGSDPSFATTDMDDLVIGNTTGNHGLAIVSNSSSGYSSIAFSDANSGNGRLAGYIDYGHSANEMTFGGKGNGSTIMKLQSNGQMTHTCNHAGTFLLSTNSNSGPYGHSIVFSGASPNNVDNYFVAGEDSSTNRFKIYSAGTIKNSTGTYTSFSDERLKSDIVDAKSQWEDIKSLNFKNFIKFDNPDLKQLGLIAQDVEKTSPNLVFETPPDKGEIKHSSVFGTLYVDGDELPEGKKVGDVKEVKSQVKNIKDSILYMKAVKALQEAMTRIETLEAKVKALEDD